MFRKTYKMKTLFGLAALLAFIIALISPMTVQAVTTTTVPDSSVYATIRLALKDVNGGKAVPGGIVTAKQIATVAADANGAHFEPVPELKNSGISFDDVTTTDFAEKVGKYITDNGIIVLEQQAFVDEDGIAVYEELPIGLWLFENIEPAQLYEAFKPFVVTTPYYNADTGLYEYEIDASPKVTARSAVTGIPTPSVTVTTEPGKKTTGTPTAGTPTRTPGRTPGTTSTPIRDYGRLPQTGQLWWPVPVLALVGAVIVMIGIFRRRSR